jgi:hypothetical protein
VSFLFKDDSRAQLYLPHLDNPQWLNKTDYLGVPGLQFT